MDGGQIPAHYTDLGAAERAAWDMMVRGANDRRHAFHQMTVATVENGLPELRTVVLRGAERDPGRVRFHTDTRSAKYAALTADPRCAAHFYDHGAKVQVRLRGEAVLHNRDNMTAQIWAGMRDFSKKCYRQPVGPGDTLQSPEDAEADLLSEAAGYENFVVAFINTRAVEWLYLAAAGHRRALIQSAQEPRAVWLAP
ncbi:MAG: pyridoxamine 5'-phosphate oxidase family protein [Pseudomonadota bacterium]